MKYIIHIPEVHYSFREVEAENEQEAIEKAWDAEETYLKYSHSLDAQFIKIELDAQFIKIEKESDK